MVVSAVESPVFPVPKSLTHVTYGSLIPPIVIEGVLLLRIGVYTVKYGFWVSYPFIIKVPLSDFCTTIPDMPIDLTGLLTFNINVTSSWGNNAPGLLLLGSYASMIICKVFLLTNPPTL